MIQTMILIVCATVLDSQCLEYLGYMTLPWALRTEGTRRYREFERKIQSHLVRKLYKCLLASFSETLTHLPGSPPNWWSATEELRTNSPAVCTMEQLGLHSDHDSVQVNLCQKYLFTCQLTHNMTTDCSMIYEFSTRKLQEQNMPRTCCLHILFRCLKFKV